MGTVTSARWLSGGDWARGLIPPAAVQKVAATGHMPSPVAAASYTRAMIQWLPVCGGYLLPLQLILCTLQEWWCFPGRLMPLGGR